LDLIQHIPSFDVPFVIDWQSTLFNCNDDETAQKLLPLLPKFNNPPSLKSFEKALSFQLFSVMDTLLVCMVQKPFISLGYDKKLTEWAIRNSHLLNIHVDWSIWDNDRLIYESELFFDYWMNNSQLPTNKPHHRNWENLIFWNSHPKVIKYFVSLSLSPQQITIKAARSVDALVIAHQLFGDRLRTEHMEPLSKEMYKWIQNNEQYHSWRTPIPKSLGLIFNNDKLLSKLDKYSADLSSNVTNVIASFLKSYYLNKSEKIIVYCVMLEESENDRQFIKKWAQKYHCNKILKSLKKFEPNV
jgi:hypothetical protein